MPLQDVWLAWARLLDLRQVMQIPQKVRHQGLRR